MGQPRGKQTDKAQAKSVAYEVIDRDTLIGGEVYAQLDRLIEENHQHLTQARIALAWALQWKPDEDGVVKLGQCKKASELDRQLHNFDFVILLRKGFWMDPRVSDLQRQALLDHELEHAQVKHDDKGEPLRDEHDRIVYRIRRHDIEEFTAIVHRYGAYKSDLELFYAALRRSAPPFTACEDCRDDRPGWRVTRDTNGAERLVRCQCFVRWSEHRAAI